MDDLTEIPEQPIPQDAVNVVDPDTLEIGSIPVGQLSDALSQGYKEATPEETNKFISQQKYGGLGQQAISGLEGAAQAATFGLSTGIERALGVPEEDILGRREENPITHMVGQAAGIGASSLIPGGGAAKLLTRAGEAGAEALGLTGTTALNKIGSGAVKGAIDSLMVQSGDEVSKMLASDPNQSVDTAAVNIGLSGILGGALGGAVGSINPLWKATVGGKVAQALDAIQGKAGGIEGIAPDLLEDMVQKTGIGIAPEIKAALSKDPRARQMFQTLQESTTSAGVKGQELLTKFKKEAGDVLVDSFGKSVDDVDGLVHLSEYDAGKQIQKSLTNELKSKIDPISSEFENISSKFSDIELPKDRSVYPTKTNPYTGEVDQSLAKTPGTISKLSDDIANLAQQEGYTISPSAPESQLINRIQKELPNINTLEDLRNYQSLISKNASAQQMWHLEGKLRNIFRNAEEDVLTKAIGETAPDLLQTHSATRTAYKESMNLIDELNSRLHVGKYRGPDSFVRALSEMSPEDIMRRISGKGDVDLLKILDNQFPAVANQVRNYHVNNLLKAAAAKASPGEAINTKTFITAFEKMSPELRSFVAGSETTERVNAIKELLNALPSKMNPSGTAKTLDSLWNKIPGTAVGIASMIAGHNPLIAIPLGYITNLVSRDAPDAIRLAMLKFLGSGKQIEAEGFKSMVDFIKNTIKGENLIGKATKNVFKGAEAVLPQAFLPDQKSRDRLDKRLGDLQKDPNPLLDIGGKMPHYMPDQGTALGQTASNATNYLNSLRPIAEKQSPLDSEMKPNAVQKQAYNRALDIAEQPLVILSHIKQGTIIPSDLVTLKNIYPALYGKLAQQLNDQIIEKVNKQESIPYKTRMGLSLFLGEPLDSTMKPENIVAAQPITQMQAAGQPIPRAKHSMTSLNKLAPMSATRSQSREAQKVLK